MDGPSGAPLAVSLTPLALEADSRTYRIAGSLAEAGFRSLVIEGRRSKAAFWDAGLEVHSLQDAAGAGSPASGGGRAAAALRALREGRAGRPGELLLYAGFRGQHWQRYERPMRAPLADAALFYVHSFEFYRAIAPIARQSGAPVIYDAHDFYRGIEPAASRPAFDRNWMRPFLDRREDAALAGAAAVVTVSEGVAGLIEETCGRRPAVIRNCHDDHRDTPPPRDLRTMLSLRPHERLCVVVGNRKPGMAIDAAIAAMARLPAAFHLAFLGRGYEGLAGEIAQAGVAGRVHVGHVVAPREVVPAIRSADVGLVLYEPYSDNYRWALPNGFFQVVAAGLPLVRGHLPEIEATIGLHRVGACLPAIEPAGLARAILECSERAAELRPAVSRLAESLRWSNEAGRLRALVATVMRPDAAPRRLYEEAAPCAA